MTGFLPAGIAIVAAWAALIGTAALCRRFRLGRGASVASVVICYAVLAGLALIVLGSGWEGRAGAAGMLLPCAVALILCARDAGTSERKPVARARKVLGPTEPRHMDSTIADAICYARQSGARMPREAVEMLGSRYTDEDWAKIAPDWERVWRALS